MVKMEGCIKGAFEVVFFEGVAYIFVSNFFFFLKKITGIAHFTTILQLKLKLKQLCIYQLALFHYPCLTLCIVVTPSNSHLLFYGNNPFKFTPFIWIPVCYLLFC